MAKIRGPFLFAHKKTGKKQLSTYPSYFQKMCITQKLKISRLCYFTKMWRFLILDVEKQVRPGE